MDDIDTGRAASGLVNEDGRAEVVECLGNWGAGPPWYPKRQSWTDVLHLVPFLPQELLGEMLPHRRTAVPSKVEVGEECPMSKIDMIVCHDQVVLVWPVLLEGSFQFVRGDVVDRTRMSLTTTASMRCCLSLQLRGRVDCSVDKQPYHEKASRGDIDVDQIEALQEKHVAVRLVLLLLSQSVEGDHLKDKQERGQLSCKPCLSCFTPKEAGQEGSLRGL